MASLSLPWCRCTIAQRSAIVCVTLFLLAELPFVRPSVLPLPVEASDNLAVLAITRSPVVGRGDNFFRGDGLGKPRNSFLQDTLNPLLVPERVATRALDDKSTDASEVNTTLGNNNQKGKVGNTPETDTSAEAVSGKPASVSSWKDVRVAGQTENKDGLVPPQEQKRRQNTVEVSRRSSRPLSLQTLEEWGARETAGSGSVTQGTQGTPSEVSESARLLSPSRFRESPSSPITNTHNLLPSAPSPVDMQPGGGNTDAIRAILSSLQAIVGGDLHVPAKPPETKVAMREAFITDGQGGVGFTTHTVQEGVPHVPFRPPSSSVASLANLGGLPGLEPHGTHVAADNSATLPLPRTSPALPVQFRLGDTGSPGAIGTHNLREFTGSAIPTTVGGFWGPPRLQQQLQLFDWLGNMPEPFAEMGEQQYGTQNRRPSTHLQGSSNEQTSVREASQRRWYMRGAAQETLPASGAGQADSRPREGAAGQGYEDATRKEARSSAQPQRQHPLRVNSAFLSTNLPLAASAELRGDNSSIQSQLEQLGYREAREIPPTKGMKTMAAGLALGATGVLGTPVAAMLLGFGAVRYMLSKRAQAKAAAATPRPIR